MLAKNQTFITYDAVKWYACMYDMDSTWGMTGLAPSEQIQWRPYNVVFQNGYNSYGNFHKDNLLHSRIWTLFKSRILTRYNELRSNVLSKGNIIGEFDRFISAIPPYLYEEDYAETTANGAFTAIPSKNDNNILQLRNFIVQRLDYVDTVMVP